MILELDTPGGSVLASEEIHDAIERLKEHDMPIVSWMRGSAASAGYYIAAPTDSIVASPNTFTGSIGVIMQYFVLDELAGKVGVQTVTMKSGTLKDMGSAYRTPTAEEQQLLQQIIDDAYGQFVDVVVEGRDLSERDVRRIGDGRIYTGRRAKEVGLVDRLGLRRDAYDEVAELIDEEGVEGDDLRVVEFSRRFGVLEILSADTQPFIDQLAGDATAHRVTELVFGGSLGGATGATGSADTAHNGFARLEYRAVL